MVLCQSVWKWTSKRVLNVKVNNIERFGDLIFMIHSHFENLTATWCKVSKSGKYASIELLKRDGIQDFISKIVRSKCQVQN